MKSKTTGNQKSGASIRAFLAAELSEYLIQALDRIQTELRSCGAEVRWVKPDNIHLTLHFFGNIGHDEVEDVCRQMTKVASATKPMKVKVEGLGAFPSLSNPKVVWVGISDASGMLTVLQSAVIRELSLMGYKMDKRPFHPHLTLGRLRLPAGKGGLREALKNGKDARIGDWEVKGMTLFRSDLRPTGPEYTRLRVIPLQGDT
jgi:2'-5' RNA ligase